MTRISHSQPVRQRQTPYRDRAYLNHVRTLPCIVSGHKGDDVDPAHLGVLGRGMKQHDYHVLPLTHRLHMEAHGTGEVEFWRKNIPGDVLMDALRLYARHVVFAEEKSG